MPAITRAAVETEVVSELGPLLTLAKKSVTIVGSNVDLNGPLGFALQALGFTPVDPTAVADVDFSTMAMAQWTQICQLTEYFVLKKCLNSLTKPNEKAQDRSQDWNEMVRRFASMLSALQSQYASLLNIETMPTVAGVYETRFPTPNCRESFAIGRGRIDH